MMRPVREERLSSAQAEGSGGMQYLPERDVSKIATTIFYDKPGQGGVG